MALANGRAPRRPTAAIVWIGTATLSFASCGGKTTVDSRDPSGGGAGASGAGGTSDDGGFGGGNGVGGAAASGPRGGQSGSGGVGGGGSAGIGGASVAGATGSPAGGFGGVGGFGGFGGFGGVVGFGPSDDPRCKAFPRRGCGSCLCNRCNLPWGTCGNDARCVALATCALASGCVPSNTCGGPCAQELAAAEGTLAIPLAHNFIACAFNSDCSCAFKSPGSAIDCETCLTRSCPDAWKCMTNINCAARLLCAVDGCYRDGWDQSCVNGCFSDPGQATSARLALECVTTTCRSLCGTPTGP
jgi:hypothetical protein